MDNNKTNIRAEFVALFPNIDFENAKQWWDASIIESALLDHINEFTAEQWQAITGYKYSELFATGRPHFDWNCDRSFIIDRIIKVNSLRPSETYSSTWYDEKDYFWKTPTGAMLKIHIEEPKLFGKGRTSYRLEVVSEKEFIPLPTHRAVLLAIGSNTKAYIVDQFAGTESECEDWVAENIKGKKLFFKIVPID